ncbi:RNA polymerase rpc34 subunit [Hirsutella rhossiliensis]|uniref:DNA-directed RNA polymerase III subunit RPC6 n=1 Tax=Hirsutella rhossiliensis TaxID=111463 RepID=A0A9P8SHM1_9HYPO|nr:RNA polymerase rpc34 subunit domain-containing protein [Hirsutella rhossiliensis]KAH0962299.1 RNA polymerase rpc34 subunit domain-containing protein [Hirsutella rhossiliensis]
MATPAGGPAPAAEGESEAAKLAVWKEALYERCKEAWPGNDLFSQDDLMRLDVIPNRDLLLLARVVQSLSDDKLFITMREASGQVLWKWRDAQEAHKYKQCATDEQGMVYSLIDDSGGDGIWSQTLQKRLNMHDSVLKNALKQLQAKGLIAPFKNVEHPNKKMYIKASIRPSDRATGGPWYTDQNLDEAFIEELQRVVFDFIKRQSGYLSTHGGAGAAGGAARTQAPKKGVVKGSLDKGTKRSADEMNKPAPPKAARASASATPAPRREAALLPLPAGYTGYPTVRDIARLLSSSGITNNTILSEDDVKKLVDVLVWDNLVEPVKVAGRLSYRVARIAKQSTESWAGRDDPTGRGGGPEQYISPLTEAPCGGCPVFDLCEEGGPVGPSNCEYFRRWLEA